MDHVPTIDDCLKAPVHPHRQMGGRCLAVKRKHDTQTPLVTVITIVRNGKETLPKTIESVMNQSYPNIEYIVVDGASTDGTLEVLRQFDDQIDVWISEPDSGTSDAFNKAASIAQGDFLFWLASDDWIGRDFMDMAIQTLLRSNADFIFGDMVMYENGKAVAVWKGNKDYAKLLMSGYPRFNFPTLVVKKECYQHVGLMDMTYNYIADYEWLLRLHLTGRRGSYNSSLVVHRRVGGIGENAPLRSIREHLRLSRQYGLPATRALAAHLYYSVRRIMGRLARLFLPGIIYAKLKRGARGCCRQVEP